MDASLLLQYGWVLLILILLEGILAADNALVMAIMVKHLPEKKRKRALFYGLAGAFIFRFGALFAISLIVDMWQVQAVGAIYLIFLSIHHLVHKYILKDDKDKKDSKEETGSGFWATVLKVEIADIAFAVDSILAAVALSMTLPATDLPSIGGMDGGRFIVVLSGGLIGVIIMRFAATFFVKLLNNRPGLETAAYLVVGWVGVKLAMLTLGHEDIAIIPEEFVHSTTWKVIFWVVLAALFIGGYILSSRNNDKETLIDDEVHRVEHRIEKTEESMTEGDDTGQTYNWRDNENKNDQ